MNMRKGLIAAIVIVLLMAPTFLGCMRQVRQAEFQAGSLTITPDEVMAGDKVTISVDVTNIGTLPGTYEGTLTVAGVEVETGSVSVAGEGKEKLTFTLVPDAGGIYDISVDGLSGVLAVKEEVELKYDDGRPDGVIVIVGPGAGYLVRFSPPATPFTINRVKIYGSLYGAVYQVQKFEVQVWDNNKQIVDSFSFPYVVFGPAPAWAELLVDDVSVTGDFYIHVYAGSTEESGVQVFFDSSVINLHSDVTENWEISERWYPEPPKEEVNWMIRVEGTIIGTVD